MGNQLSQCGNAQACFDVNDTRLELTDSGDRPEDPPHPAYAKFGASPAAGAADGMLPDDRGGHSSPRGPVGRNHSVQRSFGGAASPARGPRACASDADRMLEELRHMYGARPPADAASLAEIIVRERERDRAKDVAAEIGRGAANSRGARGVPQEEDALLRSALDVVAQRYVNGGMAPGNSSTNGVPTSSHSTPRHTQGRHRSSARDSREDSHRPEEAGPQTHFSRRKAPASPHSGRAIASGDGRSPNRERDARGGRRKRGGVSGAGRASGELWAGEEQDSWESEDQDEDQDEDESATGESTDEYQRRARDYRERAMATPTRRPPRPPNPGRASGSRMHPAHKAGETAAAVCTMEEVLRNTYGITLEDMASSGCAPPPPQLLRLRMSEAEWGKHLHRAGVDVYLERTSRHTTPASTPRDAPVPQPSSASEYDAVAGPAGKLGGGGASPPLPRDLHVAWGREAQTKGVGGGRGDEGAGARDIGAETAAGMAHDRGPRRRPDANQHTPSSASGLPADTATQGEVLPDGWKRYVSRTSGRPFYKNKATGATQWARPSAPAAQPSPRS